MVGIFVVITLIISRVQAESWEGKIGCLKPVRQVTEWRDVKNHSDILCETSPKIQRNQGLILTSIIVNTMDVMRTHPVLGFLYRKLELKSCCTGHPLWYHDTHRHEEYEMTMTTSDIGEESIMEYPVVDCPSVWFQEEENCKSSIHVVKTSHTRFYSQLHGWNHDSHLRNHSCESYTCVGSDGMSMWVGQEEYNTRAAEGCMKGKLQVYGYVEKPELIVLISDLKMRGEKMHCTIKSCGEDWIVLENGLLIQLNDTIRLPKCETEKLSIPMVGEMTVFSNRDMIRARHVECEINLLKDTGHPVEALIRHTDLFMPSLPGPHNLIRSLNGKKLEYSVWIWDFEALGNSSFPKYWNNHTNKEMSEHDWNYMGPLSSLKINGTTTLYQIGCEHLAGIKFLQEISEPLREVKLMNRKDETEVHFTAGSHIVRYIAICTGAVSLLLCGIALVTYGRQRHQREDYKTFQIIKMRAKESQQELV